MPTLDDVYETYCTLTTELLRLPASSPRAQKLQTEADAQWLSYIQQGGGREPWHTPKVAWSYQDGFEEMAHSSSKGPIKQLRKLLGIPETGAYYMAEEQSAVSRFQERHHLPVTGRVDRKTWQAILADKGELKPGVLVRQFELPGTATSAVPIVLRTRKRWMLALDDVPQRTYANQHNLAVLADYSYLKPEVLTREFKKKWNSDRLREDVVIYNDSDFSRLFIREAPKDFEHTVKTIEDGPSDTQLVVDSPRYAIVAFRGTAPTPESVHTFTQDLATDLEAKGERWMYDGTFEGAKAAGKRGFIVHRGFGKAFDSIRDELRDELDKSLVSAPTKPVFVTGHSLGGALATLCACYIRSHPQFSRNPVRLYTFAQPRVGTLAFCNHYWREDPKFSYFRMAHIYDTVTMVPSKYLAEDVRTIRGLIEPMLDRMPDYAEFLIPVPEDCDDWLADTLRDKCPPHLDYRHFGELVLCGVNTQNAPFVQHMGKGMQRKVEAAMTPRVQSVWRSKPPTHAMSSYRRFLMREFENNAKAFSSEKQEGVLPLSAAPALHAMELQLFHRFVHARGIPAYHSIEDYRHALQ